MCPGYSVRSRRWGKMEMVVIFWIRTFGFDTNKASCQQCHGLFALYE